eukprot:scaffold11596_cov28-Tisochrysis_lutea.AAC.3
MPIEIFSPDVGFPRSNDAFAVKLAASSGIPGVVILKTANEGSAPSRVRTGCVNVTFTTLSSPMLTENSVGSQGVPVVASVVSTTNSATVTAPVPLAFRTSS